MHWEYTANFNSAGGSFWTVTVWNLPCLPSSSSSFFSHTILPFSVNYVVSIVIYSYSHVCGRWWFILCVFYILLHVSIGLSLVRPGSPRYKFNFIADVVEKIAPAVVHIELFVRCGMCVLDDVKAPLGGRIVALKTYIKLNRELSPSIISFSKDFIVGLLLFFLQTSSVWSRSSLQWLWFYCDPLRYDCDQCSRGNHKLHGSREAPAARAAPRRRRVRGRDQRCRQEGRHRHNQGQSSGENIYGKHSYIQSRS